MREDAVAQGAASFVISGSSGGRFGVIVPGGLGGSGRRYGRGLDRVDDLGSGDSGDIGYRVGHVVADPLEPCLVVGAARDVVSFLVSPGAIGNEFGRGGDQAFVVSCGGVESF
jgi:hypothetical protein